MASDGDQQFYMYVLLCDDGSFYGGFTTDVQHRYETHLAGKGAKYTKVHRPVKILYQAAFDSKHDALSAEYAFKHQSRHQKEEFLKAHGVTV